MPGRLIKMKNKKAFEFSFGWLFALLIGAVILFLAIYAVTNIVENLRLQKETETGKDIGTLLTPAETTLEKDKYGPIEVKQPTKIYNDCTLSGSFGSQLIGTKIKSGIGEAYREGDIIPSSFHNKYLFSSKEVPAREQFFLISKPFEFPFKIADIMVLWSVEQPYCFVDIIHAPYPIPRLGTDLTSLFASNLSFLNSIDNCPINSKKVCHSNNLNPKCDMTIYPDYVEKNDKKLYYVYSTNEENEMALLMAAVFSDAETYDCQIQRLIKRANNLATTYQKKIINLGRADLSCSFTRVTPLLNDYIRETNNLIKNNDLTFLHSIKSIAEDIDDANPTTCPLF